MWGMVTYLKYKMAKDSKNTNSLTNYKKKRENEIQNKHQKIQILRFPRPTNVGHTVCRCGVSAMSAISPTAVSAASCSLGAQAGACPSPHQEETLGLWCTSICPRVPSPPPHCPMATMMMECSVQPTGKRSRTDLSQRKCTWNVSPGPPGAGTEGPSSKGGGTST